jgi:hypothetical protein
MAKLDLGNYAMFLAEAGKFHGDIWRAFKSGIPDEELFAIRDVEVALRPEDLPGMPLRSRPFHNAAKLRWMDVKSRRKAKYYAGLALKVRTITKFCPKMISVN